MKKKLGPVNGLYPMLTVLVGANVDGKPNYITIAHLGIVTLDCLAISSHKAHYTNLGIRQNRTFSVNIPSQDLVRQTDYCGTVSGRDHDKSTLFENVYGTLGTAPMIAGCPLSMECRLIQTVEIDPYEIFIGRVIETWCEESGLSEGKIDVEKIQPILFDMPRKSYWKLGEAFARCWSVGKNG